ncbi:hypothetical protein [Nonomuraea cavernae]|uniref:hypothetical protein n=1 Tax=Nonomuraea cavernae TaxID=2045107 RepID=UPI00340679D0
MFDAFEGLDDEAEEHVVDFVAEGPDGDVAEAEAGEGIEPLLQPLLRCVDGGPVVVVGVRVTLREGGDDGAEELPVLPVADGVGVVIGFVADGDDLGESGDRVRHGLSAARGLANGGADTVPGREWTSTEDDQL